MFAWLVICLGSALATLAWPPAGVLPLPVLVVLALRTAERQRRGRL